MQKIPWSFGGSGDRVPPSRNERPAMTVKGEALSVEVLFSDRIPCMGTPTLHWVGRAGYGRHGGEASALCVGTDDVGLEFSLPFFQEKGRKKDPQSTKISYL